MENEDLILRGARDTPHPAVDPAPKPDSADHVPERLDPSKLVLLLNASKALASTTDIDHLLKVIVSEVRMVLNCEGVGVVLYDPERDDFYWRVVEDKAGRLSPVREDIRIPRGKGVAGWVFNTGKPTLIEDAANDPRVYRPVEDKSGFMTRNMICVPLKTREKRLGVLYALNRIGGAFTAEDVEILTALAGSVAMALENAAYYESLMNSHRELERLNRVKNKTLNHLSHELKTPLAIIEASLRIAMKKIEAAGMDPSQLPFERIGRNLARLKIIEKQVSHIVEDRDYPQRNAVLGFLDQLQDLLEITEEEEPWFKYALDSLKNKIDQVFPIKTQQTERVSIEAAFQATEGHVRHMTQDRSLDVVFLPPDPAILKIQPQIIMSVIGGLIRNAIENTPDAGKVEISGKRTDDGYFIVVRDWGVGIPAAEQANIFEGFYPIQETDMYSSGSRYAFNAGGTGTDLLKIKIFSERCGFKITFRSDRCSKIPTPADACPGDISLCECRVPDECAKEGGTEFTIEIPPELIDDIEEN